MRSTAGYMYMLFFDDKNSYENFKSTLMKNVIDKRKPRY